MTDDRLDHLHEVGRLLWPAHDLQVGTAGDPAAGGVRREYLLLPSARRPRLLVPAGRRAAAGAVRRYGVGRGRTARWQASALATGLSAGLAPWLLRDRVRLVGPEGAGTGESIETHLAEVLGREVLVSLYLGAPRANRKPVLQVLDPVGRTLAWVKVGVDELTRRLVADEAAALTTLATAALRRSTVPRVLHSGRWQGLELLVQSPLPVDPRKGRPRPDRVAAAQAEVAAIGASAPEPLSRTTYWAELTARVARLPAGAAATGLAELAGRIVDAHGDVPVRLGAWHGDWTPWNTAVDGDTLLVWDWERFAPSVPVGYDTLHWGLQSDLVNSLADPAASARRCIDDAPEVLAPFDLDAATARATACGYLTELATRYIGRPPGRGGRPARGRRSLAAARRRGRARPGRGQTLTSPFRTRLPGDTGTRTPRSRDDGRHHARSDRTPSAAIAAFRETGPAMTLSGKLRRSPAVKRAVQAVTVGVGRVTSGARMTPDFLIIGGQRCGTTSMYRTLAQHPNVLKAVKHKGVHYFDTDYGRGMAWYRAHFPLERTAAAVERRTGVPSLTFESSPYYMFHPLAAERIAADLPGVKVIVLLRDPVERAYSAHAHELARGFETEDFETALALEDERLAGEAEKMAADPTYLSHSHQHHGYLQRGRYVDHLERLEAVFGRERMHVVDSHAFFTDPEPVLRRRPAVPGPAAHRLPGVRAAQRPSPLADGARAAGAARGALRPVRRAAGELAGPPRQLAGDGRPPGTGEHLRRARADMSSRA